MVSRGWCDKCGKEFRWSKESKFKDSPLITIHETRRDMVHLCKACSKGYKEMFKAWLGPGAGRGKDGRKVLVR